MSFSIILSLPSLVGKLVSDVEHALFAVYIGGSSGLGTYEFITWLPGIQPLVECSIHQKSALLLTSLFVNIRPRPRLLL